jgi:hypothetical protein
MNAMNISNSIKQITVENFQSWKKGTIELAPNGQLTVLTGSSDSGKTAIGIRALRWLLYNIPQGTDFIRVGCTFARVSVLYESGHTVIRERSTSKNQYKIIAPGAAALEVFEGFGGNVPLEIQEITGVRPVTIGDLELNLNIAEQLDGPFLGKSVTAGTRAKALGKLAGTEEIDHAGKTLGTDLYRRNQNEKDLTADLKDLAAKIEGYNYLPTMAERIKNLEQLVTTIQAGQERRHHLGNMAQSLIAYSTLIKDYQQTLERLKNIDTAEVLISASHKSLERLTQLRQIARSLAENKSFIEANTAIVEHHKNLEIIQALNENISTSSEKLVKLQNIASDFAKLNSLCESSKATIAKWVGLNQAEKNLKIIVDGHSKRELLQKVKVSFTGVKLLIAMCQDKIQCLANLDTVTNLVGVMDAAMIRRSGLSTFQKKLSDIQSGMEEFRGATVVWEQRVSELNGAYHDALASMGICTCPICGVEHDPLELQKAS